MFDSPPSKRPCFFNGGVCHVNRWQSYSEIVKAFIERGNPGHALVALGIISAPVTIGALIGLAKVVFG